MDSYFIVEISFMRGNPKHRAIAYTYDEEDEHWELWSAGYDSPRNIYIPYLLENGGSFDKIAKLNIESLQLLPLGLF